MVIRVPVLVVLLLEHITQQALPQPHVTEMVFVSMERVLGLVRVIVEARAQPIRHPLQVAHALLRLPTTWEGTVC